MQKSGQQMAPRYQASRPLTVGKGKQPVAEEYFPLAEAQEFAEAAKNKGHQLAMHGHFVPAPQLPIPYIEDEWLAIVCVLMSEEDIGLLPATQWARSIWKLLLNNQQELLKMVFTRALNS